MFRDIVGGRNLPLHSRFTASWVHRVLVRGKDDLEAGDGCVEEAEAGVEDEHEQKEEDRNIDRDSYTPVLLWEEVETGLEQEMVREQNPDQVEQEGTMS